MPGHVRLLWYGMLHRQLFLKLLQNLLQHKGSRKLSERRAGTHMARNRDRRKIRETNEDTFGNVL